MTYVRPNFKTKKALKTAIDNGETVVAFEPGLGTLPRTGGRIFLEGPHAPEPHKWYAQAMIDPQGNVTKITG